MVSAAEVKKYGAKIGLDIVGVTSADPFPEYVKIVQNRIKNRLVPIESQEAEDIFKRLNFYSEPEKSLLLARSVLSLGMRFFMNGNADATRPGVPCGRIGRHYWRFLRRVMEKTSEIS